MRTLCEDILHDRRRDFLTLPLRAVLRVFAALYGAIVGVRATLYSWRVFRSRSVPCRVVSIGNITVGGTGKTPVVIMTARMLVRAGYRTAVVSRGYRRKGTSPLVVSDGQTIFVSSAESGDEPHLIASSLPGVPVVVGIRRYAAARLAWERFQPDIILLDDAFQHLAMRRDADVVTLDAAHPFGSGFLLPRGTLRESPRVLSRARAVIVTRCPKSGTLRNLEKEIQRHHPDVVIFYSRHVPTGVRRFSGGAVFPLELFAGQRVAALSNIANPASFHATLESLGAEIVWKCVRPDHYRYGAGEAELIGREAAAYGADLLVLTAKDERDMPSGATFAEMEAVVLDIEAVLTGNEAEYLALVSPERKGGHV